MLNYEQTGLEEFSFGDGLEDKYYILVNKNISPDGIDFEKLKLADPRTFDQTLNEMGCILMLDGKEILELSFRGEVDKEDLHRSLYDLAREEGIIN